MNIVYLPSAKKDISQIITYIAIKLNAKTSAKKLLDEFDKSISVLADFPNLGKKYKENVDFRFLIIKNYTVFYKVYETEVLIHRVIYVKREFENLL